MDAATKYVLKILRRDLDRLAATVQEQGQGMLKLATAAKLGASQIERGSTGDLGPLSVGTQDFTVTWPTPFPDTAYMVVATRITGTAGIGTTDAVLKSKTAGDCVITVRATVAVASLFLDVLAVRA